jgi:hypothetical protein
MPTHQPGLQGLSRLDPDMWANLEDVSPVPQTGEAHYRLQ